MKQQISFQQASKIIEIIPKDERNHEYILKCRFCGDFKPVETDTPKQMATFFEMAQHHKNMGCGKEVSHV